MNIEDIQDEGSLRQWLMEQESCAIAIAISTRAVLRVQPRHWSSRAPAQRASKASSLLLVWPTLASSVASTRRTETLKAAANAANGANPLGEHNRIAGNAAATANAIPGTTIAMLGAQTVATAISDSPHLAPALWKMVRSDCLGALNKMNLWCEPLWFGETHVLENWVQTKNAWNNSGAPWSTFAKIYDDFWHGREPDWDYIERIVLIDPDIWEAGPEAVAEAIQIIDEQQRLAALAKAQLESFRRFRDARSSSGSPGIGHNNPPESLSDEASREVLEAGASAGRALEELAEELAKTDPSSERLDESSNRLLKALSIVAKYCGQKLDLAVDTLIKWGIPVGGAWLVANYTELSALANGAKALARLLGG